MKWYRVFLLLAVLGVAASCANPVSPFPQEDEEPGKDDEDPPTQGFLLNEIDIFFV